VNAVEQARVRVAEALERAAAAHEAGRCAELQRLFEIIDIPDVRVPGADGQRIGVALNFFDGWVDALNHDWLYYEGIEREDWPRLARALALCLREDRELDAPQLARFDRRAETATRTYAATFSSMAGLVGVAAVFLIAGAGTGLLTASPRLVVLSSVPLAWLALGRLRLRVRLTPDSVAYRGLFSTRRIRVPDISWAGWAAEGSWVASRLIGPFVYELRTPSDRLRINLKLFPLECSADLTALIPPAN
jgi:hypothetical protein